MKIKSMVYSTVKIIMVINLYIVPMLIPTVHVSSAIEITVLKGAGHDLNLLDIRANLAVYLVYLPS